MRNAEYTVGPIRAKGACTVDFALPGNLPLDQLPAVIERDRVEMAKRPGMRQKHLPFRVDAVSGNFLSGGRYLFDSVENAERYKSWAADDFVLDGVKFFERPFFLDPVCHVWTVVGAHDLRDMETHAVIRSERWRVPSGQQHLLEQAWVRLYDEAARRGLSSLWLLHSEQEEMAGLVSIAGHAEPPAAKLNDGNLQAIESSPSLGLMFDQPGWMKVFDRTSWVLSIWLPLVEGQPDVPALWPNSPPLPAPAYAQAVG